MTLQELLLSTKAKYRMVRHLLCWVFYGILFHFQNDNRTITYDVGFMLPCIFSAYAFSYFLYPFLQRKVYGWFVFWLFIIYITTLVIDVASSYVFFTTAWEGPYPTKLIFGLALHNQTIAIGVGGMALGIKATKSWYVRQLENQALEKQKARNELKLEKANLYPEFILQSLNSLQLKIQSGAVESPVLLLKLSDTLSYILYDSQNDLIELEKELAMVQHIIAFKKLYSNERFAILFSMMGDLQNKSIAPLTLFKLIQNLFQLIETNEQGLSEVRIKIQVENDLLSFQLTAIYSSDPSDVLNWRLVTAKVRAQLNTLYHSACEFRVSEEECMYSISIGLGLTRARSIQKTSDKPTQHENILAQPSSI